MKKNPVTVLSVTAAFTLTVIILLYPSYCLVFACQGLHLWFDKMIPALFPFMVLSGIMIRMNLTEYFARFLSPVLKPLLHINDNCIYAVFVGFLCGFPMGAHVSASLYEHKRITKKEAEFLLTFCNNIGPVYFISFALPTIGFTRKLAALIGMYGIPFLYGLFMRYFYYSKEIPFTLAIANSSNSSVREVSTGSFLAALDESVISALNNITKLGGYMIVFNLLNVIPYLLFSDSTAKALVGCFLEITGGLTMLKDKSPFLALCLLAFGGLSCVAQTYSMIRNTDLPLKNYIFHKIILTLFSAAYYFGIIAKSF